MWIGRNRIYMCKDPQYVICAVAVHKLFDTIEKLNEVYAIDKINNDPIYKELYSYYAQCKGNDFIPVALEDKIPRLGKLPKFKFNGIDMYWCVGYVNPYIVGGNKALLSSSKTLNSPSYELLLTWLKHHVHNYSDSIHSGVNQLLASDCLRAYVRENKKDFKLSQSRHFKLTCNNKVTFMNGEEPCDGWIEHLENLSTRNFYEIIVNDFE